MNKYNMVDDLSRLRWACRRGMLELDLILERFLSEKYTDLSAEDKQRFIKLLECPDPDLFAWLMGKEVPDNADIRSIVDRIRIKAI